MRFLQADYHPVHMASPCFSLDFGPSYAILNLADVLQMILPCDFYFVE